MELIVLTLVLLHNPRYLFYFSVQVLPELLEKSYFSRSPEGLLKSTWTKVWTQVAELSLYDAGG